jgi:ubiquinone/menaquinone biosynthesis C-methylase UbiE
MGCFDTKGSPFENFNGDDWMSSFDERAQTWDENPKRIEREKIIAESIRNQVQIGPKDIAFEYGCGTGLLSFSIQPYLRYITMADHSEGMLGVVRKKIEQSNTKNMIPIKLDLESDKVPDEKYNLVYSLLTLHHIRNLEKTLNAFHTLLHPKGSLCIADLVEEEGYFHGADFNGHNGFKTETLEMLLKQIGFVKVNTQIVYQFTKKGSDGIKREYPVFLMTAQKN